MSVWNYNEKIVT